MFNNVVSSNQKKPRVQADVGIKIIRMRNPTILRVVCCNWEEGGREVVDINKRESLARRWAGGERIGLERGG